MDKATIPIFIFAGISVIAAVVCHSLVRRTYLASVLAGIASSILFQVGAFIDLGYLDPFVPVALVFGAACAGVIALLVGAMFHLFRKQKS